MENNEGRQWENNYLSDGLMTIEHVRSYTRSQMPRLRWTPELHNRFLRAIQQLGGEYWATPKMILGYMNVEGLNLSQIKSHLQRYRNTKNEETTQGAKARRTFRDSGNSLTIGGKRVSHQTQRSSVNNFVFGYPYDGNYSFHHEITPMGASNTLAPGMERGEGSDSWTSTYGSTAQPSIIISDLRHGSSNMENGNQRDEGKKSEVINMDDDDDEVTDKLDGEVDSSLAFSSLSKTSKRMKLKDNKVEGSINLSLSLGPPEN